MERVYTCVGKRVTGRFYVFLLAILVIAFLIVRPHLRFGTREAIIEPGSASYSQKTDAVIIRDESVFSSGTIARVNTWPWRIRC